MAVFGSYGWIEDLIDLGGRTVDATCDCEAAPPYQSDEVSDMISYAVLLNIITALSSYF